MIMDDFGRYMNPPRESDGVGYVERHNGDLWLVCPYCGKRALKIRENTIIHKLTLRCKGSNCKMDFEVDYGSNNEV